MDSHLRRLASGQMDVVAAWQLLRGDWTPKKVQHHAASRGWRRLHPGVYVLSQAEPSREQRWWAAALTAPETFLSHGSGGDCFEIYAFERPYEVVTRPGQGGRRRQGGVLVFRSKLLEGETTTHGGIPITTAERVLVDLVPSLDERRAGRCFREALRLRRTTTGRILRCVERHGRQPALLAALARRYAKLPYGRTRSDAEALALELLHDAGVETPLVNARIAGEEADLAWPPSLIVEIDGPQFHQFRDEDARKAARWREAGYDVRRVSSGLVYDAPAEFVERCRRWLAGAAPLAA
jgi:hypothetical protein